MHTQFLLHNKRACVWCQLSPIRFGRSWLTAPASDMPHGTGSICTTHKFFCRNMQLRHDQSCIQIAKRRKNFCCDSSKESPVFSRPRLPADSLQQSSIVLGNRRHFAPEKYWRLWTLIILDLHHYRWITVSRQLIDVSRT